MAISAHNHSKASNDSAMLTSLLLFYKKQQPTGGINQPVATKTGKQLAKTKVARSTHSTVTATVFMMHYIKAKINQQHQPTSSFWVS